MYSILHTQKKVPSLKLMSDSRLKLSFTCRKCTKNKSWRAELLKKSEEEERKRDLESLLTEQNVHMKQFDKAYFSSNTKL